MEVEAVMGLVEMVVEDTMEKEIRTKNNWTAGRKAILAPDDEIVHCSAMHCCTLSLCYLGAEKEKSKYKYRDHLVGD